MRPEQCLFIGDHPRWDVVGPKAVGISPILLDRRGSVSNDDTGTIRSLDELLDRLE